MQPPKREVAKKLLRVLDVVIVCGLHFSLAESFEVFQKPEPMMANQRRMLVATYHSYVDLSSGAAISLRDMVEALAARGWEVRVLSGPRLDYELVRTNEELLREQGIHFDTYRSTHQGVNFQLHTYTMRGVDCAVWIPESQQADPDTVVGAAWLGAFRELLDSWKPNYVVTYGGFWMATPMLQLARKNGARTIFYLCNFAYTDRALFSDVDAVVVLSEFQAQWYKTPLGIESHPVYPLIPRSRYQCSRDSSGSYVSFVNPQPHKGVYVFAKIAEVLNEIRPDIPFLVVESRGGVRWLARTGAKLNSNCVFQMSNTPDSRNYLGITRIMLMPSVWQESFGRVAAEAMLNGIPVIGSNRGALPEVVSDFGTVLDLPEWITSESRRLPQRDEIENWLNAIQRLWDDNSYYETQSHLAKLGARRWDEADTAMRFEQVLKAIG